MKTNIRHLVPAVVVFMWTIEFVQGYPQNQISKNSTSIRDNLYQSHLLSASSSLGSDDWFKRTNENRVEFPEHSKTGISVLGLFAIIVITMISIVAWLACCRAFADTCCVENSMGNRDGCVYSINGTAINSTQTACEQGVYPIAAGTLHQSTYPYGGPTPNNLTPVSLPTENVNQCPHFSSYSVAHGDAIGEQLPSNPYYTDHYPRGISGPISEDPPPPYPYP